MLIASVVRLMDFKLRTVFKTTFRKPSSAISHLLKFSFSPKKREETVNVSVRFLTDSKSLRKKVESSAKAVYKKSLIKDFYSSNVSIIFD